MLMFIKFKVLASFLSMQPGHNAFKQQVVMILRCMFQKHEQKDLQLSQQPAGLSLDVLADDNKVGLGKSCKSMPSR